MSWSKKLLWSYLTWSFSKEMQIKQYCSCSKSRNSLRGMAHPYVHPVLKTFMINSIRSALGERSRFVVKLLLHTQIGYRLQVEFWYKMFCGFSSDIYTLVQIPELQVAKFHAKLQHWTPFGGMISIHICPCDPLCLWILTHWKI